jgi:ABC-type phosphate transport system substrate-binding protein
MKRLILILVLAVFLPRSADATEPANIVVIVNPASGVDQLTRNEVIDIFLGRYRKLPSGRAALPIDVAESSTERERFYQLLVKKSPADMSSYWARLVFSGQTSPPFQVPDSKTAIELVQSNPNAIAYVDRASVGTGVKVVLEIKP